MQPSALLNASHNYGGPWKLLSMSLRGGQFIGATLALSIFAWLMAILSGQHLPTSHADKAVEGISAYLMVYILAWMPATWFCFERPWFWWGSTIGDIVGMAGSIAIAVLTRGSTMKCSGLFTKGETDILGVTNVQEACRLQKVVFATGISNS